jgi:type IV pilus assembly protein PilY1
MKSRSCMKRLLLLTAIPVVFFAPFVTATADVTELDNAPLASGLTSTSTVKPNVAFVFDDSGSMDDQNMPDAESTNRGDRCWGWHKYNTLFYNPAQTYLPPFKLDGDEYSDGVTRFPDADFAAALKDGYFPLNGKTYGGDDGSNTTTDLRTLANLTPNAVACSIGVATATITTDGNFNSRCYRATSLTVNVGGTNIELLNGAVPGSSSCSSNADTFMQGVADSINARTGVSGFSASFSSYANRLTISAPMSAGNLTVTPNVIFTKTNSQSGSETFTRSAFGGYTGVSECASSPSKYYYSTHISDANAASCETDGNYSIVTDADKIGAPGIPETGRTAAEITKAKTNYANWYTYYRRRAQLMKAATAEAFKDLDEGKYRAGLFFLNSVESGSNDSTNHPNNDLKIAGFSGSASGTQRYDWFDRLYKARADLYTPLRGSLTRMGRMFAGKISGWDPVQYSCQQNFTIFSTDGYWNTDYEHGAFGPKQIDGTTDVGNTDGGATAAVAATATLTSDGTFGSSRCYRATSVTVDLGGGQSVELLNSTPVPASCTQSPDDLGQAIATSINAKASTGFSASYSNSANRLTVTAPLSLGAFTGTFNPVLEKVSGSGSETFTKANFSGGAAAVDGAILPYRDELNISNTLADIAYYYYGTDLRTAALGNCSNTIDGISYAELCENNVFGAGNDTNKQQHMTTFTVGLGVSGEITYERDYTTAANISGVKQYVDIANGTEHWPEPDSSTRKIDDLWHAAVNGRGTYYSASNVETLKDGLQSALQGISSRKGSASAAATSSLQPVPGDNSIYVALYQTGAWWGDLEAYTISATDGQVSSGKTWSARDQIDDQVSDAMASSSGTSDGRTIWFFDSGEDSKLNEFRFANLDDSLDDYFLDICSKSPTIDQCGDGGTDLTADQILVANSGENLVNYLRGRSTHEARASNAEENNKVYRVREHVLGDIVNATPVYVKKPPFSYADSTYATFKSTWADRAPTVYVAANDGMLHAVNATNGSERWAYVPRAVMPNMYALADRSYGDHHQYFVDGSPTVTDICSSVNSTTKQCATATAWKTVLIGGLNKGGCSVYALDITSPTSPKGMWEFTNENLGYSFGKPVVAKRSDGKWVVFISSGYNNYPNNGCGTTGDGNGHLFVLDAETGALLEDIETYTTGTTEAGSVGTPSGLAKLNAWVTDVTNPVADRVYGGDILGNVWRFDYDNQHLPAAVGGNGGKEAVLLAQLADVDDTAQPITVKPVLAELSTGEDIVMVGTGRFLGTGDKEDDSQQSVYAIKDALVATGIGNARDVLKSRDASRVNGTGDHAGETVTEVSGGDPVDWGTDYGWYFDLNAGNSAPGERVNVDMLLQFNKLVVPANVPEGGVCTSGGRGNAYTIDIVTGRGLGFEISPNALIAGINLFQTTDGVLRLLATDSTGNTTVEDLGSSGSSGGAARRTSWRELVD